MSATGMTSTATFRDPTTRWRDEYRRLRNTDRDAIPDVLGPPEVFSDTVGCTAQRREYGTHRSRRGDRAEQPGGSQSPTVELRGMANSPHRRRVPPCGTRAQEQQAGKSNPADVVPRGRYGRAAGSTP